MRLFTLVVIGFGTIAAAPANTPTASAKAWLTEIYRKYTPAGGGKGAPWGTDKNVKRYFDSTLAERILQDRHVAAKKNDAPILDGDPFIDAQDWSIASFDIATEDLGNARCKATVRFKNAGTPSVVTLDLVQAGDAWRISDIHYSDGRSLLETLHTA
jgi:hypothetical protein